MNAKTERILHALISDMSDRRGLGDELDMISEDTEIWEEMLSAWRAIVAEGLKPSHDGECTNCESTDLSWFMHDGNAVLGCNSCSETLRVEDPDVLLREVST